MTEELINAAASDYLDKQDTAKMFCGSYEGWQMIDAFIAGANWYKQKLIEEGWNLH